MTVAKKKPAAAAPAKPKLSEALGPLPGKKQRAKVVAPTILFEAPVKFGNVSIGKKTGKVGFSVQRSYCTLAKADELFVDRRLAMKVILGRAGDAKGQQAFTEPDVEINGDFDVKGFRVGADAFSGLGMTFMLKEVDLAQVSHLSGGSGRIQIKGVKAIPADAVREDLDDEDKRPIVAASTGPWRDISLKEAMPGLTPAMKKNLANAGLVTMGDFADRVATKGDFWPDGLVGIGSAARQKIEDWNADFWQRNPQYSQQVGAKSSLPPK